jgi:hypothetical protein
MMEELSRRRLSSLNKVLSVAYSIALWFALSVVAYVVIWAVLQARTSEPVAYTDKLVMFLSGVAVLPIGAIVYRFYRRD